MNDEIDLLASLQRIRLSSPKLSNMSSAMSGNLDSNSSIVRIFVVNQTGISQGIKFTLVFF